MRLFIASGFSAAVIDRIGALQKFARPLLGGAVKWVEPGNIHLTYAFLGETGTDEKLAAIRKRIDETAAGFRKVDVALGGLGAFPSLERPRVLWLGLNEGGEALKPIAVKLFEGLTAEGFGFDHDFSAHLTIARVKARPDRAALASLAEKAEELKACRDTVASLELMESRLTSAGPEYRSLYSKEFL